MIIIRKQGKDTINQQMSIRLGIIMKIITLMSGNIILQRLLTLTILKPWP